MRMSVISRTILLIAWASLLLAGCGEKSPASSQGPADFPIYTYQVVNVWPHDRKAFTQGLVYFDGHLFESTGLNGQSSLRKVDLKTGEVLQKVDLASEYFAEGLATVKGNLYQLTWQNGKGFVYAMDSF